MEYTAADKLANKYWWNPS